MPVKVLSPGNLELRFNKSHFGVSARRFWECTELGQTNVFGVDFSDVYAMHSPATFIDLIQFGAGTFSLVGCTMFEYEDDPNKDVALLMAIDFSEASPESLELVDFVHSVCNHLDLCAQRLAIRNNAQQFLPSAKKEDIFGVPYVFSHLHSLLSSMGKAKADRHHWLQTIENFRKKGLRNEELERSNLIQKLADSDEPDKKYLATELTQFICFNSLRMSVIPVVKDAERQLNFNLEPGKNVKLTKTRQKLNFDETRSMLRFDPVLGYRIERVDWLDLWGHQHFFQAVTHKGEVIDEANFGGLVPVIEAAESLATTHSKFHFPKRMSLGHWSHISWSGGKDYKEWLITLPFYAESYFSTHFKLRNVLAHVRCDIREGPNGERVLFLQEVQSDWAQSARREISAGAMEIDNALLPPFLKEWPALVMKLVLLHASVQKLDAIAWTKGKHQVRRYKGLGEAGLIELYDKTLPREVNRIMKTHGVLCQSLEIFVPKNFRTKKTESGYEVYSQTDQLLGEVAEIGDATQLLPEGTHETLMEVHGVCLASTTREKLLLSGFPAWG